MSASSASSRLRVRGWVDTTTGRVHRSCTAIRQSSSCESRRRRVDVLLPVRGDQEVAARLRPSRARTSEASICGRKCSSTSRMGEPVSMIRRGCRPSAEQVPSGVLGVDEVEVGHVVDEPAVGLLRDVLVEAAVARLHVVDGDPHPLGHHRGDAGVGVAEHEHGVRPLGGEHPLGADERAAQDRAERRGVHLQVVVRGPQPEVVEEDLVERVVVVLPGVDEDVVDRPVQPWR